jgi:predicted dehydrogenase
MLSKQTIVRAGLVGCGSVAQRGILPHLMLPDARERVQLLAVVDVVEERARRTAERFHVPAYFSLTAAMLAGANIDLVIVASPIPYHFEIAREAIEAGKHVYVQKAMTNSLAEAGCLVGCARSGRCEVGSSPRI